MIKQIFEIVPASIKPNLGEIVPVITRPSGVIELAQWYVDLGKWVNVYVNYPFQDGFVTHWLRPAKGLFIPEEKVEEHMSKVSIAYTRKLLEDIEIFKAIRESNENFPLPSFAEFYNLMKEK